MRIFKHLYFVLILFTQEISGQTTGIITDVNFWLEDNRIVVKYNMTAGSPELRFNVGLKFLTETDQVIVPKSLTGDIGKNITAGEGKKITWDFVSDQLEFSGVLKAVVVIAPPGVHSSGPYNALLSAVVPGLGDYFVDDNKVRPPIIAISTLGLMTYGIIKKSQSNKYYSDFKQGSSYENIQALYDKANSAHHKYYIATRIAAVIWIADIIWVARKGTRNLKESRLGPKGSAGGRPTLNYVNNDLLLGYQITF